MPRAWSLVALLPSRSPCYSSKLNVRFLAKVNVNDQRTLLGRTLQKMSSLAECGTMWRRTSSTSRHQGQRHGEYQCWRSYWWQGRGKCLLGTWTPVKFINYGTSYVPHENYWAPYGGLAFPLDPQVLPPTCQFLQKTQFHHPTLLPAYKIKHLLVRACGIPAVGIRAVDCWQWRNGQYFHQSFFPSISRFFSSVATFSHRRSARIKNLI